MKKSGTDNPIDISLPFFSINAEGHIIDINEAAEKITGYPSAQLIASEFSGLFTVPLTAAAMIKQTLACGFVTNFPLSFYSARKKHNIDVSFNAILYQDKDLKKIVAVVTETEKHKTAKEEDDSKKKILKEIADYKYALDESSIVAITDQKGIIKYVNDNFCKISKYASHELMGQDHRIINSGYHPKTFIRDLWTTIAKGKIWKGEVKNKAKDGSIIG